jgi:hypothetical protein
MKSSEIVKYNDEKLLLLNKMLINKYGKSLDNTHKNTVYKFIENATFTIKNEEKKYSDSWKRLMYNALKNYYECNGINTNYISKIIHKYYKKVEKEEEEQKQSAKELENYLDYDKLSELRKQYENYTTIDGMYRYLLLTAIASDQGVCRPQIYANIKFVTNETIDLNNKINNFLNIDTGELYINNDKISKKQNKIKTFDIDVIKLQLNPEYYNIIKKTYNEYKREWLFDFKVKCKRVKLLRMIQQMTGKKITFNMARSSYINHLKLNINSNYKQRKQVADEMRHNVNSQMKYYEKISPINNNITINKIQEKNNDAFKIYKRVMSKISYANKHNIILDDNFICLNQIDKIDNKYITKLERPNTDGKKHENALRLLKKLNNGEIKKPKESTLNKYNIEIKDNQYTIKQN